MITVEDLSKTFGARTVWREVNFTVARGDMLALVGPSGSGKSTLLNCLGLLDRPSAGTVRCEGRDITRFGRRDTVRFRRDTLGYLFQSYALIENATVAENLDVVVRLRRSMRGKTTGLLGDALERVGLSGREKEPVHQLSGGEQQRVALARLLLQGPSLVLADEPTGALDDANSTLVVGLLREMAEEGCAVVIATHDAGVRTRCDAEFALGGAAVDAARTAIPATAGGEGGGRQERLARW
ncbi:ABC transporter ATP-binding protein [Streptomyces sp. NPDC005576]|uniref:ABC transporter ATP-binding protein n=1 Tax=unclassified Streptomyces TaxID=2593676 RepID=UPI0033CCAE4B